MGINYSSYIPAYAAQPHGVARVVPSISKAEEALVTVGYGDNELSQLFYYDKDKKRRVRKGTRLMRMDDPMLRTLLLCWCDAQYNCAAMHIMPLELVRLHEAFFYTARYPAITRSRVFCDARNKSSTGAFASARLQKNTNDNLDGVVFCEGRNTVSMEYVTVIQRCITELEETRPVKYYVMQLLLPIMQRADPARSMDRAFLVNDGTIEVEVEICVFRRATSVEAKINMHGKLPEVVDFVTRHRHIWSSFHARNRYYSEVGHMRKISEKKDMLSDGDLDPMYQRDRVHFLSAHCNDARDVFCVKTWLR